ncbi:MAG: substrate-binding domain-containing protein [Elainella sp.]
MKEQELRNNLKQIRSRLGMSQQDLARLAGVTRQTISGVEAGQYAPSVAITLRLAKALGCQVENLFWLDQELVTVEAIPAQGFPEGQRSRVSLARIGDRWVAYPLTGDQVFQTEMIPADGEANGPGSHRQARDQAGDQSGDQSVQAGNRIPVTLFEDLARLRQTVVIAGWEPALSLWARAAERWHPELRVRQVLMNSRDALQSLLQGEAHMAGMRLYDPQTNEHNLPFVQSALRGQTAVVIGLGYFEEGLLTQPGNPKQLTTVASLSQPGVKIVNREVGSGSRLLLEQKLQEAGIPVAAVDGFDQIVLNYQEVARAVLSGAADAGISTAAIAEVFGLGFIPLHRSRYDLVILQSYLEEAPVQQLLSTLGHRKVLLQLQTLGGYDTRHTGEVIATLAG